MKKIMIVVVDGKIKVKNQKKYTALIPSNPVQIGTAKTMPATEEMIISNAFIE